MTTNNTAEPAACPPATAPAGRPEPDTSRILNGLSWAGQDGKVIGVVQDFNFKPIQQAIEPLVLKINRYGGNVVVRAPEGQTEATIRAMEAISRKLNPSFPFAYNFLDQDLASLYKGERQMSGIFNLFAGLALLISCLGLYGLSAYLAPHAAA